MKQKHPENIKKKKITDKVNSYNGYGCNCKQTKVD